ncbi:Wzy polymerase domain-containing protein [Ottowia sp.]|uniref:PglL family O-oligosaccharyltransferase n=1 Tax=Ottowia sp. TaxID=1898956 RepID=UPI003A8B61A7
MLMVVQRALLLCLLVLSWLWPHTSGPVAATEPYLVSVTAAALLLALWPAGDVDRATRWAAWGWLAAAVLSSAIALLQYFNLEAPFHPFINIADPGQAFGNLRQPNQLASLLVIGLLALRWLVQAGRLAFNRAIEMGVLLVLALAATASRAGLVELLACGALALWWAWGARQPQRARRTFMVTGMGVGAVVLVYALAALALPWVAQSTEGVAGRNMLDRLQHAESTCGSRLILWRNVLHLMAQKPWTGWGWGELDYAHFMTLYDGPRFCHILDNAHNLPLHLAVELGVPVALAACAAAAWLIWRGKPWAEQQPTRQLAWGVLLAIGIHSLVEYPLWYGPFQIATAIGVWLLWVTRGATPQAAGQAAASDGAWLKAQRPRRALPVWRGAVATAMLAAAAYAGWDYHRISQVYLAPENRSAAYRDAPMQHAERSWLFADSVRFAQITSRPVTRDNAAWMLPHALLALHFSPEPNVVTRVIESATYLGLDDLAMAHLARFAAAFAHEHQAWMAGNVQQVEAARAKQAADSGAASATAPEALASGVVAGASAAP